MSSKNNYTTIKVHNSLLSHLTSAFGKSGMVVAQTDPFGGGNAPLRGTRGGIDPDGVQQARMALAADSGPTVETRHYGINPVTSPAPSGKLPEGYSQARLPNGNIQITDKRTGEVVSVVGRRSSASDIQGTISSYEKSNASGGSSDYVANPVVGPQVDVGQGGDRTSVSIPDDRIPSRGPGGRTNMLDGEDGWVGNGSTGNEFANSKRELNDIYTNKTAEEFAGSEHDLKTAAEFKESQRKLGDLYTNKTAGEFAASEAAMARSHALPDFNNNAGNLSLQNYLQGLGRLGNTSGYRSGATTTTGGNVLTNDGGGKAHTDMITNTATAMGRNDPLYGLGWASPNNFKIGDQIPSYVPWEYGGKNAPIGSVIGVARNGQKIYQGPNGEKRIGGNDPTGGRAQNTRPNYGPSESSLQSAKDWQNSANGGVPNVVSTPEQRGYTGDNENSREATMSDFAQAHMMMANLRAMSRIPRGG